jgi:hypothetical protein
MYRLIRQNLLLFVIPWVTGMAVAVFAPDDVLTRTPMFRDLVDALSQLIPSLKRVGSRSNFPEVATLYHAVMWLSVPLYTFAIARSMVRREGTILRDDAILYLEDRSIRALFVFVGMILISATIVVFLWVFQDGREIFGSRFNSSRLFLGVFGAFFPFAFSLSLALLIAQGWSVLRSLGVIDSSRGSK